MEVRGEELKKLTGYERPVGAGNGSHAQVLAISKTRPRGRFKNMGIALPGKS